MSTGDKTTMAGQIVFRSNCRGSWALAPLVAIAALATLQAAGAELTRASPVDRKGFEERFDDSIPSSNVPIYGLALAADGQSVPDRVSSVRVQAKGLSDVDAVCLSAFSHDGRFEARNEYVAEASQPGELWEIGPLAYTEAEKLNALGASRLADVSSYTDRAMPAGEICSATEPILVPAVASSGQTARRLVVLLNAEDRRAEAVLALTPPLSGVCNRFGSDGALVNTRCTFELDDRQQATIVPLQVTFRIGRLRDEKSAVRIALPGW